MSFYFQPPDLAEFPRRSYRKFLETTLGNLFTEISPIGSEFNGRFEISFVGQDGKVHWRFEDYTYDSGYPTTAEAARKTNMTHARRLQMEVWLRDTLTNELRKSVCYMGDVPVITDRGTFVINGSERVVLGQLVRAPGVYFQMNNSLLYKGLILAELGAPVSIELDLETGTGKHSRAKCRIKLPKRGWVTATTVLTAMGIDTAELQKRLGPLLEKNRIEWKQLTQQEALAVLGRAWKPDGGGGVAAGATALKELTDKRRYSMGTLGRRRFNKKLGVEEQSTQMTKQDLLVAVEYILNLPLGNGSVDNIDSLENRHLRGVGDVLTRAVRPALAQMSRSIRTRLELHEEEEIGSPNDFIDTRPFVNAISKFFSGNPLVQYLDQQNPLSELSHRRRITSFGPGGIDPNAAPTEMRDVHPSQIGRVCLVESPEGKNCGMVSYLATYCRIDDDGFMTVPYRRVINGTVTDEVVYLTPADDKRFTLAPPDTRVEGDQIVGQVNARRGESFFAVNPQEVDMIGIAPQGFLSVGSGLIPFLEHDDANRALMGGGMMRQTLPLIKPERPRVGTGMEKIVARSSGHSVVARRAGTVTKVTGTEIRVTQASGEARFYPLTRYDRTNQNTVLDQRPIVREGQQVEAGQIIADGPGIDQGELALGRNLLIAFVTWNGYNYEDAIVVRQGLIRDHKLSHIEIEKHSCSVYQTLRGPEILTPELPNIATKDLEHLDERGIAKIGSYVQPGDILVSKLSPKEARAMSAEEELLQSIFGKVAEEMADSSLRVPHGSGGRVVDIRIFTPETTPELKAGVICEIEVLIARLCPVEVGDKLAGRHGNKGIVSIIVPDEDMPYLPDGTPVDLCLNPLGVPSRMNVGQVFDTQLGLYSSILNRYYRIHQFDESLSADASFNLVNEALAEVRKVPGYEWMPDTGKVTLYDGRTGEPFDRPVLVGRQYMLKLNQLVLHKINARSGLGGPYAAVTQQPVGGKANHGGQRMGEMEVWAIQAYGAAHLLNEMMTIKSDDIQGRHQAYADMVQGKEVTPGGRTAAFDGLCCELRGLGLEVTLGRVLDDAVEAAKEKATRQQQGKTLEEEYMVSSVDKFQHEGKTIVEIPAGDYEPVVKPQPAPMITALTNARNGGKPRYEVSEEPLIDAPEEEEVSEDSLVSAFVSDVVGDAAGGKDSIEEKKAVASALMEDDKFRPAAIKPEALIKPAASLDGYALLAQAVAGEDSDGFDDAESIGLDADDDLIARAAEMLFGSGTVAKPVVDQGPNENMATDEATEGAARVVSQDLKETIAAKEEAASVETVAANTVAAANSDQQELNLVKQSSQAEIPARPAAPVDDGVYRRPPLTSFSGKPAAQPRAPRPTAAAPKPPMAASPVAKQAQPSAPVVMPVAESMVVSAEEEAVAMPAEAKASVIIDPVVVPAVEPAQQQDGVADSTHELPARSVAQRPAIPVPVVQQAAAPVVQEPAAPVVQEPAVPVVQAPAAPVVQEPAVPVVQAPAAPVVQEPAVPVVQQPVAPVVQAPAPPVVQAPAAPVVQEPAVPVVQQPIAPVVQAPAAPVVQKPAVPVVQQPAPPVVQLPAPPVIRQPAPPVIQQPAAPVIQQPAAPVIQQPAAPVIQQPKAPVEQPQPIQPVVESHTTAPGSPALPVIRPPAVSHPRPGRTYPSTTQPPQNAGTATPPVIRPATAQTDSTHPSVQAPPMQQPQDPAPQVPMQGPPVHGNSTPEVISVSMDPTSGSTEPTSGSIHQPPPPVVRPPAPPQIRMPAPPAVRIPPPVRAPVDSSGSNGNNGNHGSTETNGSNGNHLKETNGNNGNHSSIETNGSNGNHLKESNGNNSSGTKKAMVDFPSLSELNSLSNQLARLKQRQREQEEENNDSKQGVTVTE